MKKPEQIGPYTLIAPLGQRPHARTWLASAGHEETRLALKIARPKDVVGRARILYEMALAGGFNHPNIVRLYECGEADGIMWLSSEFVPGPRTALTLTNVRQLLLALVHVHANDVVHACIEPANLLQDAQGNLRLANFAGARRAGDAPAASLGRLDYQAPEQLAGGALDLRADLYGAAVVLYEVLTGQVPYQGGAQQAMRQPAAAASSVAPGLGTSFDALLDRALAHDREKRFSGAFEFLAFYDEACRRGVRPHA